jgi:hypothetical protein
MRLTRRPLAKIAPWDANPKLHDLAVVVESIRRYGMNDPVGVNVRTRTVLEGHGRVEALRSMQAAGDDPPRNVVAKAGDWLVPVLEVDLDPADATGYALAHNRLTEAGGWDSDALARELSALDRKGVDVLALGFTADELDVAVDKMRRPDEWPDPEAGGSSGGPEAGAMLDRLTCPVCGGDFDRLEGLSGPKGEDADEEQPDGEGGDGVPEETDGRPRRPRRVRGEGAPGDPRRRHR